MQARYPSLVNGRGSSEDAMLVVFQRGLIRLASLVAIDKGIAQQSVDSRQASWHA